jgi:hypothetical protein
MNLVKLRGFNPFPLSTSGARHPLKRFSEFVNQQKQSKREREEDKGC